MVTEVAGLLLGTQALHAAHPCWPRSTWAASEERSASAFIPEAWGSLRGPQEVVQSQVHGMGLAG